MRKTRKTATALMCPLALLTVLCVTSCQEKEPVDMKGKPVVFAVSTEGNALGETLESKAVYSGQTSDKKERIDWEAGDRLSIHCSAATPSEADYTVDKAGSASGAVSAADISPVGDEMTWGEGEHTFYAVYPSPLTTSGTPITKSLTSNTVTASLPDDQNIFGGITGSGAKTASPDLLNMLMTAKATQSGDVVYLRFTPLTTAIKFTVENGQATAITLKKLQLLSESSPISGDFSVDLDEEEDGYPKITAGASTDKKVTISLPATITLAKSQTLTFTFFLSPVQDVDDLTFKFYTSDVDWMTTKLGYVDGGGIWFPRCRKTELKGLLLETGAQWTVKYAPVVEPWNYGGSQDADPMPEVGWSDPVVTPWESGVDTGIEVHDE